MKREKFNKQKVVMRTRKKLNEEIDIMRTITKKKTGTTKAEKNYDEKNKETKKQSGTKMKKQRKRTKIRK